MMLYFDHSATTPPYEEVVAAVGEVMKNDYGNPSSIHGMGLKAEQLVRQSREVAARALGVRPEQIIFTSGGTESNNMAIKGIAFRYRNRGNHIITTGIEHASVYDCCRQLEAHGYRVTVLPADRSGAVRPEDVDKALTAETILVSVMHVNNETGRIQPIREIGALLKHRPKTLFHVDAVQGIGKVPVDPIGWGIDCMAISAHKFRGPKGVGVLVRRKDLQIDPLLAGGGQEHELRSGTENVPLIVGMAKALRMTAEQSENDRAHMAKLRQQLIRDLCDIPGVDLTGSDNPEVMAPHIIHLTVQGVRPEVLVHALERYNIFVSTKSACASGRSEPSRILLNMGYTKEQASSGLRISLSPLHRTEDIDAFCRCFREVLSGVQSGRV